MDHLMLIIVSYPLAKIAYSCQQELHHVKEATYSVLTANILVNNSYLMLPRAAFY